MINEITGNRYDIIVMGIGRMINILEVSICRQKAGTVEEKLFRVLI